MLLGWWSVLARAQKGLGRFKCNMLWISVTDADTKKQRGKWKKVISVCDIYSAAAHLWLDCFENRSIHERNLTLEEIKRDRC